jgi:hypothetical protein
MRAPVLDGRVRRDAINVDGAMPARSRATESSALA